MLVFFSLLLGIVGASPRLPHDFGFMCMFAACAGLIIAIKTKGKR